MISYYEKFFATGEVKCIDEEIPFEIPQGWEWVRLGNIATIIGGYAYKSQDFINSSNNQVLRLGNIKNDFLKLNASPVYISDDLATKTDKFRCHLDDILITMTGTRKKRDYFFSYKVEQNDLNYFINQRVGILRFYISEVSMFMIYALKAENTLQNVFQYETGTANQGNLGAENIAKVYIPLPPLSEQLRIVSKIKELMPLVVAYEQTQNELNTLNTSLNELLRKSILQEAIQGKLVPQAEEEGTAQELLEQIRQEKHKLVKEGKLKKSALTDSVIFKGNDNKYFEKRGKTEKDITEEIPFEIPDSWAWVRLNHLCNITNGFTPLRAEPKFWENGTINWFTVEDIRKQGEYIYQTSQKITELAVRQDRIVRAGSVLLCCTASVGQCAMTMIPTTTNQQFNALTIKEEYRCFVNDEFLFLFAKTLEPILHDLAGKTTFEFISVKKLGNILIPIPPVLEQHRICKVTNKAIASIIS